MTKPRHHSKVTRSMLLLTVLYMAPITSAGTFSMSPGKLTGAAGKIQAGVECFEESYAEAKPVCSKVWLNLAINKAVDPAVEAGQRAVVKGLGQTAKKIGWKTMARAATKASKLLGPAGKVVESGEFGVWLGGKIEKRFVAPAMEKHYQAEDQKFNQKVLQETRFMKANKAVSAEYRRVQLTQGPEQAAEYLRRAMARGASPAERNSKGGRPGNGGRPAPLIHVPNDSPSVARNAHDSMYSREPDRQNDFEVASEREALLEEMRGDLVQSMKDQSHRQLEFEDKKREIARNQNTLRRESWQATQQAIRNNLTRSIEENRREPETRNNTTQPTGEQPSAQPQTPANDLPYSDDASDCLSILLQLYGISIPLAEGMSEEDWGTLAMSKLESVMSMSEEQLDAYTMNAGSIVEKIVKCMDSYDP